MAALIFLSNVSFGFYDQACQARAVRFQLHQSLAQQSSANLEGGAIEITSFISEGTTQPEQVGIEDLARPSVQVPRARLRRGDIPVSFLRD